MTDEEFEKGLERLREITAEKGLRPEVLKFAQIMEMKLKENDYKAGWEDCTLEYLELRLRNEIAELQEKLSLYKQDIAMGGRSAGEGLMMAPCPQDIHKEAADVANFAMMIAYVTDPDTFTK